MFSLPHRIMILVLLLSVLTATNTSSAGVDPKAAQFWQCFRNAVIGKNVKEVSSMTKFPLEVRGITYDDPVKHYDQRGFRKIYPTLINQRIYLSIPSTDIKMSMYQVVKEKKELAAKDFTLPTNFRVEQFVFQKVHGRWFFTIAYLEE